MEPMLFNSEELVPFFTLSGSASINEGAPLAVDPVDSTDNTRIISTSQNWFVNVQWTTNGVLNNILSGNFFLQVFLEKIGGDEVSLMPVPLAVPFVSAPNAYSQNIPFNAGDVTTGLYKVALALTMRGPLNVPAPIAAVAEGPVIQFYDEA